MSNKQKTYYSLMDSPIGFLELEARDGAITCIRFAGKKSEPKDGTDGAGGTDEPNSEQQVITDTIQQLREYFAGNRKEFSIPLRPEGTEFQRRVWKALMQIPYGETRSYGEVACMVGNPRACRAVGMANHNNPVPILIPCHRVVGKNGNLTGYAGGLDKKTALLELERSTNKSIQI